MKGKQKLKTPQQPPRRNEAASESLLTEIAEKCPGWQSRIIEPDDKALSELQEAFNVSGYWSRKSGDVVDFSIDDLELDVTVDIHGLTERAPIDKWVEENWSEPVSSDLWAQISGMVDFNDSRSVDYVTVTLGMPFCGTKTAGYIRVTHVVDGTTGAVYLQPLGEVRCEELDRTFGPMWESPDGDG